uniref:helix-turn-helix domain-containing protein n=1 Tax=Enterocloster aldenensis TaxID=358742 RepID=UPI001F34D6EF
MRITLTMLNSSKKEAENMAVCYDKLWKLMIDKKINKTQLCEKAKITTNAMAKLGRNEDVRVETLAKICNVLNCTMDDIMELNKLEDGGNSK